MKTLLAGIVLAAVAAAPTMAASTLTYTTTSLGGGLTGITFYTDFSDSQTISAAATITFTGAIQQKKAFGAVTVNTQTDATTYTNIVGSGYSSTLDTWVFSPWADNLLPPSPSISETAGSFSINVGAGTNGITSGTPLAYIVTTGDVSYSGNLFRATANDAVSGTATVNVPEPASLALLALGAGVLTLRRRRTA